MLAFYGNKLWLYIFEYACAHTHTHTCGQRGSGRERDSTHLVLGAFGDLLLPFITPFLPFLFFASSILWQHVTVFVCVCVCLYAYARIQYFIALYVRYVHTQWMITLKGKLFLYIYEYMYNE
jgi:hypothetical protein